MSEAGLRRFRDEAEQLRRFRNERYIVSCLNYFEANGTAYLVMDHDDGLPLSEFLRQREAAGEPFTEADLRAVIEPLLEALAVVHRAGVLHRDIKPGNIFVRRPDDITGRPAQPVLMDFGAAKQNYLTRHSRSQAPYTPGFAAYEQVSSEGGIGPWTDMYAIGALMWRMVAGGCAGDERLFVPDDADKTDGAGVWSPTPRPAEKRAYVLHQKRSDPMVSAVKLGAARFSPTLLQAIDRCLALYPEDRVRICAKLLELLESQTKSVSNPLNLSAETMLATSTPRAGKRFRDGPDSPEMVVIPEGTFRIGSPHQIWVPSARTGLSETARDFLMCTGPKPKSTGAVLANVRNRLFGWIRQHEEWSGYKFQDLVEDSKLLPFELKWELRDGNLEWIDEPVLNEGLGHFSAEALEAGYELNPRFLSSSIWSDPEQWFDFNAHYFYTFEEAIIRSDRF